MIAPDTQTVGQSLTLQCEVTTVRGITSRVNIVWSSDGTVLRRINDTTVTTMVNSLVYTDSYTISQLNTTGDGRVIYCEVVINASPVVMANDSIALDVTSEYGICSNDSMHYMFHMYVCIYTVHAYILYIFVCMYI